MRWLLPSITVTLLATLPACTPSPETPRALQAIDLLYAPTSSGLSDSPTSNGLPDSAGPISKHAVAPIRVGDEIKRALALEGAGSFDLGPVEVAPGSELRFDYALLGPEPARLRVTLHPETGENEALLFEHSTEAAALSRWRMVSVAVPDGFTGPARFVIEVASNEPDHVAPASAWADLVVLPPESSVPVGAMNLVLVTLDTVRADHLSIYGYERDTTPFLREFARESHVHLAAYTPSTWTLPAHASLFTGQYPSEHGAITVDERLGGAPLPEAAETLAEVLNASGYLTMGIVAGSMLERAFGLDQGFTYYSDHWVGERRRAPALTDLALRWIDRAAGRPFFLFLNYFDAHTPYDPAGYDTDDAAAFARHEIDPTSFHWRFMRRRGMQGLPDEVALAMIDRYDAEIAVIDAGLRQLMLGLEARGLADRTLICIVGDHGESFGEHGRWGHGGPFYEPQARVPLLYRNPRGGTPAALLRSPLSIVELPSVILADLRAELADLRVERGDAEPAPLTSGLLASSQDPAPVYGERYSRSGSIRMLRVGDHKYLVRLTHDEASSKRREQLFDLSRDPEEERNLASVEGQELVEIRQRYAALLAEGPVADESRVAGSSLGPDPLEPEEAELEQKLRALGYLD